MTNLKQNETYFFVNDKTYLNSVVITRGKFLGVEEKKELGRSPEEHYRIETGPGIETYLSSRDWRALPPSTTVSDFFE